MTEPTQGKYGEALTAIGDSADRQVADLQNENAALGSQIEGLIEDVAEADATINRLRVALGKCRAKLPSRVPPIVFGSSTGAHSANVFAAKAGTPLQARRTYSRIGQSFPTPAAPTSLGSIATDPAAIDGSVAQIRAYLMGIPTDHDARIMVSHEPETPQKFYSAAAYVHQQERVREIVDDVNDDREIPIRFGGCFQAWSARPESHRDMTRWVPKTGTWDFLAWDGYQPTGSDATPAEVFDHAAVFTSNLTGVHFAIAETGLTTPENTSAERVAWIKECRAMAEQYGAEFWAYWDGKSWGDNPDAFKDRTTGSYLLTAEEFTAVVKGV